MSIPRSTWRCTVTSMELSTKRSSISLAKIFPGVKPDSRRSDRFKETLPPPCLLVYLSWRREVSVLGQLFRVTVGTVDYHFNFSYIWRHFDRLWDGLILSLELAFFSILIESTVFMTDSMNGPEEKVDEIKQKIETKYSKYLD